MAATRFRHGCVTVNPSVATFDMGVLPPCLESYFQDPSRPKRPHRTHPMILRHMAYDFTGSTIEWKICDKKKEPKEGKEKAVAELGGGDVASGEANGERRRGKHVGGDGEKVLAVATPRASLKTPDPPTIGISRYSLAVGFRPRRLRVLPLYSPPVNTKLNAISKPISLNDAEPYIPWAWPTIVEFSSGPTVNGSSAIDREPNKVLDLLVMLD
nr:hypothetical protein PHAVU_001G145400g [Ipomoea batatas]